MVTRRVALAGLCALLLLCGCAAEGPQLSNTERFLAPLPDEHVYVVPLLAVMVPPAIEQGIFDRLVDELNNNGGGRNYVIVKRGRDADGRAWLQDRHVLTGEIFGFRQNSGCCSTELRLSVRLFYHQPGIDSPTLTAVFPRVVLFDHDRSTLEVEQRHLIDETAQAMAKAIIPLFIPTPSVP